MKRLLLVIVAILFCVLIIAVVVLVILDRTLSREGFILLTSFMSALLAVLIGGNRKDLLK